MKGQPQPRPWTLEVDDDLLGDAPEWRVWSTYIHEEKANTKRDELTAEGTPARVVNYYEELL